MKFFVELTKELSKRFNKVFSTIFVESIISITSLLFNNFITDLIWPKKDDEYIRLLERELEKIERTNTYLKIAIAILCIICIIFLFYRFT